MKESIRSAKQAEADLAVALAAMLLTHRGARPVTALIVRMAQGFTRGIASVWIARRIAGRLGAYAEALGSSRERPDGPAAGFVHGGLTFQVRSWMHLDLHGGAGSAAAGWPRWIGIGVEEPAVRETGRGHELRRRPGAVPSAGLAPILLL